MRRSIVVLAAGAGMAMVAGGCGSAPTVSGPNAQIAQPVATINLTEKEYSLTPAKPTVPHSGIVSIIATNAGTEYHALRVVIPGGGTSEAAQVAQQAADQIGEIDPGQTRTLNIRLAPGTYEWYCPLSNHQQLGMKGRIKVL